MAFNYFQLVFMARRHGVWFHWMVQQTIRWNSHILVIERHFLVAGERGNSTGPRLVMAPVRV